MSTERPVRILRRVTFEEVRDSGAAMIFYGAVTCWWTHDPAHLGKTEPRALPGLPGSGSVRLPCDPRGGVLMQTEDVRGFLQAARDNAAHYGALGLETFMAAHHLNCTRGGEPWCMRTWPEYEAAVRASRGAGGG